MADSPALEHFVTSTEKSLSKLFPSAKIFIKNHGDNPSAYIDIDTSNKIATITVWSSGAGSFEIIDIGTERRLWREFNAVNSQELDKVVEAFLYDLHLS